MSQWMKYYFYVKNFAVVAQDEEGQGLAEYGLIIALVAVVAIAGVTAFRCCQGPRYRCRGDAPKTGGRILNIASPLCQPHTGR